MNEISEKQADQIRKVIRGINYDEEDFFMPLDDGVAIRIESKYISPSEKRQTFDVRSKYYFSVSAEHIKEGNKPSSHIVFLKEVVDDETVLGMYEDFQNIIQSCFDHQIDELRFDVDDVVANRVTFSVSCSIPATEFDEQIVKAEGVLPFSVKIRPEDEVGLYSPMKDLTRLEQMVQSLLRDELGVYDVELVDFDSLSIEEHETLSGEEFVDSHVN